MTTIATTAKSSSITVIFAFDRASKIIRKTIIRATMPNITVSITRFTMKVLWAKVSLEKLSIPNKRNAWGVKYNCAVSSLVVKKVVTQVMLTKNEVNGSGDRGVPLSLQFKVIFLLKYIIL